MVEVECLKFSNSRVSTPSKLSFSNDTQSKQCEEITSTGFKASLSNIFSQGLTSQQTLNACIDGKDKGTSNESYSLRKSVLIHIYFMSKLQKLSWILFRSFFFNCKFCLCLVKKLTNQVKRMAKIKTQKPKRFDYKKIFMIKFFYLI